MPNKQLADQRKAEHERKRTIKRKALNGVNFQKKLTQKKEQTAKILELQSDGRTEAQIAIELELEPTEAHKIIKHIQKYGK